MRFWRRTPRIEDRLRAERPQPSEHLVQAIGEEIGESEVRPRTFLASRVGRLVFAAVFTLGLVASLAGFGGLSYAASSAGSASSSAVKLVKVTVGLKKSPSAADKATKNKNDDKKGKKGKDDDDKKKKKKKKKDKCDDDDPDDDQYCDDDDDDNGDRAR